MTNFLKFILHFYFKSIFIIYIFILFFLKKSSLNILFTDFLINMLLTCLIIFLICRSFYVNYLEEIPVMFYILVKHSNQKIIGFFLGYVILLFMGLPIPGQSQSYYYIYEFLQKNPEKLYQFLSNFWVFIHFLLNFALFMFFVSDFIKIRHFFLNNNNLNIKPLFFKPNNIKIFLSFLIFGLKIYLIYNFSIIIKISVFIFKFVLINF